MSIKDQQFERELKEMLLAIELAFRDLYKGGNGYKIKNSMVGWNPEDGVIYRRSFKTSEGAGDMYCHIKYK